MHVNKAHEDFIHRIWEIAGSGPFISANIANSVSSSPHVGRRLAHLVSEKRYFIPMNRQSGNKLKVYKLSPETAKWCEQRFGSEHFLAASTSRAFCMAYQRTRNYQRRAIECIQ